MHAYHVHFDIWNHRIGESEREDDLEVERCHVGVYSDVVNGVKQA